MQNEQVFITTYNTGCLAVNSQFKKLVVFGITTRRHALYNLHQNAISNKSAQELHPFFLGYIPFKSFAPQDIVQFFNGHMR